MYFLYNILINLYGSILKMASLFNAKAKLLVDGRSNVFKEISEKINKDDKPIWFHAASLGEFEQGRPLIEELKEKHPEKKILLTFYSPSGYEVMKNYDVANWVLYLPLDSAKNAKQFVEIVNPQIAIFIKYEFWPNIINALFKAKINTIVVSAIFREDQVFFKKYGGWMRESLRKFSHLFVQDQNSVKLLNSIGITEVQKSGDTRFDRVLDILKKDDSLDFVEKFKSNKKFLVAGSTWPKDDSILLEYINNVTDNTKVIIAPHNISEVYNHKLISKISNKTILYSEIEGKDLEKYDVLILDTIGLLTKVYKYADIAYVGGGFGKEGIHNILEPAVFSIPVITGPIYGKFKEAVEMKGDNGLLIINNKEDFVKVLEQFHLGKLNKTGINAFNYIKANAGAQDHILNYISQIIKAI